jgi:hypothetical protein
VQRACHGGLNRVKLQQRHEAEARSGDGSPERAELDGVHPAATGTNAAGHRAEGSDPVSPDGRVSGGAAATAASLWMGSAGPWMGFGGLSTGFFFYFFIRLAEAVEL